ncbi:MAG: phosphoribosylamine--glycine ligase [Alistipes sp.]|nr:phosphoribosylamine--glycine ligase [Alistipes sp.]
MKVLVIGSGGRCHAIVDALAKSPEVEKIYCAPGNAGIAAEAQCVAIADTDAEALADFAERNEIGLTVVGPEAALERGVADCFKRKNLRIFGPTKAAARIESSKDFAKRLMTEHGVPTAAYRTFTDYAAAVEYVRSHSLPTVLKYDGLAAGKGVVIAQTFDEAEQALRDMLVDDRFGHGRVVVEEFLQGEEFSLMCFVSGRNLCPMPVAQDHKRAYDNDEGPNTGGMGAYTGLPFIDRSDIDYAMEHIMRPVAEALDEEGTPFCGVLYGGLIKTADGIKVIEFNARFGDPETEVVLPLLESDLCRLMCDVADGKAVEARWSDMATIGVVLASKGYPGSYEKGCAIDLPADLDATVYHMGTKLDAGRLVTAGGRVMIVVCAAATLAEARDKVRRQVERIGCDNLFHRNDIADKAFKNRE